MKIWILTLMLLSSPFAWAQQTKKAAGTTKEAVDAVYKIRIAAMQKPFNEASFNKFKALGSLSFEPADNGFTRIYLGNYLGRSTAQKVLAKVKQMGFPKAYLMTDNDQFIDSEGRVAGSTLQFSAVKELHLAQLVEQIETRYPNNKEDLYIYNQGGFYRLSMGLFAQEDVVAEGGMRALVGDLGYRGALLRKVRNTAGKGGAIPAPSPVPNPVVIPEPITPEKVLTDVTPTPPPPTRPGSATKWEQPGADGKPKTNESANKWNQSSDAKKAAETNTPTTKSKWNTTQPAAPGAAAPTTTPGSPAGVPTAVPGAPKATGTPSSSSGEEKPKTATPTPGAPASNPFARP